MLGLVVLDVKVRLLRIVLRSGVHRGASLSNHVLFKCNLVVIAVLLCINLIRVKQPHASTDIILLVFGFNGLVHLLTQLSLGKGKCRT